jgi:dihydroorotase
VRLTKYTTKTQNYYHPLSEKVVLKNGTVIDPVQNIHDVLDILIEEGFIRRIAKNIDATNAEIIDISGKIVAPGFFDMHVHLREPGREDEETIATGSAAASNGGFTGIACMPNTNPPVDSQEIIQYINDRARGLLTNVYPIACITKKREGKELAEILELVEAGAVGISDDGSPVMNTEVMRRALEYSKMSKIPVICHEEDSTMTEDSHMNEGYYSTLLGVRGWPAVAESIMVERDIALAKYTGGHVHIAHISTREAVEAVRRAKKEGVKVTAEVTPHHFSLTDEAVTTFDTNTKMNPPLRSEEDRQAIIEAIKDGTIDAIATDHAPHSIEEKDMEYIYAPFGIIGLETAIGITMTYLVEPGYITLEKMIELFSKGPREILGIPYPAIKEQQSAELTIFDPTEEWEVDVKKFKSQSINTPFAGKKLKGKPYLVINNNLRMFSEL